MARQGSQEVYDRIRAEKSTQCVSGGQHDLRARSWEKSLPSGGLGGRCLQGAAIPEPLLWPLRAAVIVYNTAAIRQRRSRDWDLLDRAGKVLIGIANFRDDARFSAWCAVDR